MSRFDNQINRMRELCTYGRIDEDEKIVNRSIEHKETAADGVTYGIIRECSKFYIESCPKGKENLVEAYDYLGGFNNKKDYEYTSYPMALKQFRIKMDSINESVHAETDTDVIEAQNQQLMTEGGTKMQNEIARMKQIMRNAAIVMNESSEMMTGAASVGKSSDKNTPFTETVKACENGGECGGDTATDPEKQGEPFVEKPKEKKNEQMNEGKACCDESEEDFDVDADDEELDTMEDENPEITDDEPVDDGDELADEDEEDEEPALEIGDEESDDEADFSDSEVEDEEPVDDVQAKIAELQAQIDALKAQAGDEMGGDENIEVEPIEDEPMGDESDEFDFDEVEDFSDEDSESFEDDDYLSESRKRRLNKIVESIIGNYKRGGRLNEDELHDFGRHPGYRKKPFSLPPTGEDSNAHGKDINHDSVHNEKPFGQSKGDSTPFSILVDRVYKDVVGSVMERKNLQEAVMDDVVSKLRNIKKKVK